MNGHLCRCGTYPRILKAIQLASTRMAGECDDRASRSTPFSRRDLLKGGGALIVGFSLAGVPLAGVGRARRRRRVRPIRSGRLPGSRSMPTTPPPSISASASSGRATPPALLQIAAEELDLDDGPDLGARLDTHVTPNQGATSSSSSIERGGPQLRAAAAEARRALLLLASRRLGVQINSLVGDDGVVSVDGEGAFRAVKYGELLGDKPFNIKFTGHRAAEAARNRYKLVGTRRAARRHAGQGQRQATSSCTSARARHAARPRGAAARTGRVRRRRQAAERRRELDQATSRPPASCARATSSASSPSNEWDAVQAARRSR